MRKRPKKLDVAYGAEYSEPVSPTGTRYGTKMSKIFGESGYLESLLEVEAAGSLAISKLYPEKVPREAAAAIKKVANVKDVRPEEVRKIEEKETHHETGAVIKVLAKKAGKYGRYVHFTMTSADAVETAKALQIKKGLCILIESVEAARDACLSAALEWKGISAIARTHGQHAMPASFGMAFAFFGYCLQISAERLYADLRDHLHGKFSGAIGTFDVSADEGMDGEKIQGEMLRSIGIAPAEITMQIPPREDIAYVINDIAVLAGRLESIAEYIKTLKRNEILELQEMPDKGVISSSAMPHKNLHGNPHIEERCISISRIIRGYAVSEMEAVHSEDFRDLTASLSDRIAISESFVLADYSARLIENLMQRVEPVHRNIERNLNLTNGVITSQRIMSRLISKGMERSEARNIVNRAASKAFAKSIQYSEVLLRDREVRKLLSEKEVKELGDPKTYIGASERLVERIAKKYMGKRDISL